MKANCYQYFLALFFAMICTREVAAGHIKEFKRDTVIHGDTMRAHRAYNPLYEDTVTRLIVKLGYLYTDSATTQEFYDNFLVGLRILRFGKYKVVKYAFGYLPPGADYTYTDMRPVSIPMAKTYLNMMSFHSLRPGDRIYIDTEVQKDGANYTLKMPAIELKIIPDRNR